MVRFLMASLCSEAGYRVKEAAKPSEALRLLDGGDPIDVLVTDFTLPEMNGVDLIRKALGGKTGPFGDPRLRQQLQPWRTARQWNRRPDEAVLPGGIAGRHPGGVGGKARRSECGQKPVVRRAPKVALWSLRQGFANSDEHGWQEII